MGYILKYKLWESKIHKRSNPILEQETSGFVNDAAAVDNEEVKAAPGYLDVINWWAHPPKKLYNGKYSMDKVELSKTYWLGDVSSKQTGNKRAIQKIEHITTVKGAQKILNKINKAYGPESDHAWKSRIKKYPDLETVKARISDGYYDAEKIADAASQISSALSALTKKGKRIGGIQGADGEYLIHSGTGDRYLGILPFADEKYFSGKKVMGSYTPLVMFDKWYNQISEGGVTELIDKINDPKHWDKAKAWATLKAGDKIKILEELSATSKKRKKNISDATLISISPKKSKFTEEKDPTPWVWASSPPQGFPTGENSAANFMEDDSSTIRDEYKPEFINWVKEKAAEIAENEGEDVTIDVQLIASTSQVPSNSFDRTASDPTGNIALVNSRVASMKQFVNETLTSNHMPEKPSYVETIWPNNGPSWEDVKNDATMGTKGARTQAYKDRFSEWRYSTFVIRIKYKTKSRDEIVTMKEVGEWNCYINWSHHTKPPGSGPVKKNKNEPWKPYDGKTCPIFPKTKGKVKVNMGWL